MTRRTAILASIFAASAALVAMPALGQDAAAGQAVFKAQCSVCHSPLAGKNAIGPSLFGIVGRSAGKVPGFHYSQANQSSSLTWDAATLDRYLPSPQAVVPHTTMSYVGLKDPQKRADLIAYLATLK